MTHIHYSSLSSLADESAVLAVQVDEGQKPAKCHVTGSDRAESLAG